MANYSSWRARAVVVNIKYWKESRSNEKCCKLKSFSIFPGMSSYVCFLSLRMMGIAKVDNMVVKKSEPPSWKCEKPLPWNRPIRTHIRQASHLFRSQEDMVSVKRSDSFTPGLNWLGSCHHHMMPLVSTLSQQNRQRTLWNLIFLVNENYSDSKIILTIN